MTLFDPDDAGAAADEAIDRVERHADADWLTQAEGAVRYLARRGQPFTTDDVWPLLAAGTAETHEPRAMGAVMRKLVTRGVIRKTGRYVKSRRAVCHANPKAEWVGVSR